MRQYKEIIAWRGPQDGGITDGVRISPIIPPIQGTPRCADTGKEITATEKMTAAQIIAVTQKRYGRALCAERWMELVEEEKREAAGSEPTGAEPTEPEQSEPDSGGESDFERMMREGQADGTDNA